MRLTESIYSKNIRIKTPDTYALSLDILKGISSFAKVIEKRNNCMSDGPRHASEVIFEAVKELDEHTKIKLSFELRGKENILNVSVDGIITVNIIKYGFVSDVFSDYYIKNVYPRAKKDITEKSGSLIKQVEKVLRVV